MNKEVHVSMDAFGPQAGEASWASLHCMGGPHSVDRDNRYPSMEALESKGKIALAGAAISYDGTETGAVHTTPTVGANSESVRWNLPA